MLLNQYLSLANTKVIFQSQRNLNNDLMTVIDEHTESNAVR